MHERGVFAFADRRDEAIGGQLLAGAGAGWLLAQGVFKRVVDQPLAVVAAVELGTLEQGGEFLGEAVNQQIAEPHGDAPYVEGQARQRPSSRSSMPCWAAICSTITVFRRMPWAFRAW